MQLGMIGLGRMGSNMVQRLLSTGIECVVYDANTAGIPTIKMTFVAVLHLNLSVFIT